MQMNAETKLILRLLNRTEMGPPDQCWEWQGSVSEAGHGRIWVQGRVERAHRVSYRLFVGPIPPGDMVRHTCDNPPCINPNHLCLGSGAENVGDMMRRGRHRSGWAKLTADQVVDIRERLAMGMPKKDVSERYKITVDHVRRIEYREVWQNAEGFDTDVHGGLDYNAVSTPF